MTALLGGADLAISPLIDMVLGKSGAAMKRNYYLPILIMLLAGLGGEAFAQILPPQSAAQKHLATKCWTRANEQSGLFPTYPLWVYAPEGLKTLGVDVHSKLWMDLPYNQRLNLVRNIACMYAGGRMDRHYWYDFSMIDSETGRVVEAFSASTLWPKSGAMR